MTITITKRWDSSAVVFSSETAKNRGECILQALAHKIDLSDSDLLGSNLRGSNLSGSNLSGSDLRGSNLLGSNLRGSNLSGSDLRDSNLSGSNLSGSNLSGSNLSGSNLSDSNLRGSNLRGSNLSGSNLSGSDLRDSNLLGSNLRGSNLSRADVKGTTGLSIENLTGPAYEIPKIEFIHQKVLAAATAPGCSLEMGTWHTCETTHCRAGWAIHLAGAAGKELEARIGSAAAGMRIYFESDPDMEFPRFFTTNEKAMAQMVAEAEREKAEKGEWTPATTPA